MASFGVSFLPGSNGESEQDPLAGRRPSGVPPAQQAVRLLSLRLPRFAGPNAIAPPSLMNAQGAMGNPLAGSNNALGQMLQRLLAGAQLGPPSMPSPGMAGGTMGTQLPPQGLSQSVPPLGPSLMGPVAQAPNPILAAILQLAGRGSAPPQGAPRVRPGFTGPRMPGPSPVEAAPMPEMPVYDQTEPELGNRGSGLPTFSGGPFGRQRFNQF